MKVLFRYKIIREIKIKNKLLKIMSAVFQLPTLLVAQHTVTLTVNTKSIGEHIIGDVVIVQGTYSGSVTDLDGKFTINNVKGTSCCLITKFLGYVNDTVCINLPQDGGLAIALIKDTTAFEEVIVYGNRADENSGI